jgi:hypothetical protein
MRSELPKLGSILGMGVLSQYEVSYASGIRLGKESRDPGNDRTHPRTGERPFRAEADEQVHTQEGNSLRTSRWSNDILIQRRLKQPLHPTI